MAQYEFDLLDAAQREPLPRERRQRLLDRPWVHTDTSLAGTAVCYRPDADLAAAINTAIAVGEPLLLTGEPGTGKTQAAYFVAHQLTTRLFHFQVKSNSTAGDLLYEFDTVRYFRDAQLARMRGEEALDELDKNRYVDRRPLWQAFDHAKQEKYPAVLLWLQVLAAADKGDPAILAGPLKKLPFLSTLIKHPEDLQQLHRGK
jgi:MoxR-like ATPase